MDTTFLAISLIFRGGESEEGRLLFCKKEAKNFDDLALAGKPT
jgi:hypothetical protein